eukprot:2981769-Ditylum_brightwellii.AAC.1
MLGKYWKQRCWYQQKGTNSKDGLKEMEVKLGLEVDVYQGNKTRKASGQLRLAIKTRRRIQNNSFKTRQEFIERRADKMSTEDNADRAKSIKHMKDTESKRRMYSLLRWYLKSNDNRTGLLQVDVPEWDQAELVALRDNCLPIVSHRQIVVKEEMEKALFHQH